jgi:hypothetical protein
MDILTQTHGSNTPAEGVLTNSSNVPDAPNVTSGDVVYYSTSDSERLVFYGATRSERDIAPSMPSVLINGEYYFFDDMSASPWPTLSADSDIFGLVPE